MNPVSLTSGDGPVILGMPHVGTYVPKDIFARLTPLGKTLGDTDWHIDELYDGLLGGATIVRANFHRYVIDANRDPSGASLYPGKNTTGLVPLTDFDGKPLWTEEPSQEEVAARLRAWHAPYHATLAAEVERVHARHGVAILYDCHSIRSRVPFLFEGELPDFNIGTNDTTSCAPLIEQTVAGICANAAGFASVVNGRFKGGWTTRHYGRPHEGVHAIQMELAQKTHLKSEAGPFDYDEAKAGRIREHLAAILTALATVALRLGVAA